MMSFRRQSYGVLGIIWVMWVAMPVGFSRRPNSDQSDQRWSAKLTQTLATVYAKKRFKDVDISVCVWSIDDGAMLYGYHPDQPLIAASASKIFIGATSLVYLSPSRYIETPVFRDGPIEDGTIKGSMYVKGMGDPMLFLADLSDGINAVKAAGIRAIDGDIVVDASYFDTKKPSGFGNGRHIYTPVSALSINDNSVFTSVQFPPQTPTVTLWPETAYAQLDSRGFRFSSASYPQHPSLRYRQRETGDTYRIRGAISPKDATPRYLRFCVSRPPLYMGTLWLEYLKREGIDLSGTLKTGRVPTSAVTITAIRSQSVFDTVSAMHRESNNLIANTLSKQVGATVFGPPGTVEKGLKVIRQFLHEHHIVDQSQRMSFGDASGLSLQNRFSARQFIQTLDRFFAHPKLGFLFLRTLSVLQTGIRSYHPLPPKGISLFVKTGTLPVTGVNSLVGYWYDRGRNRWYAFSILANQPSSGRYAYSGYLTAPILKGLYQSFIDSRSGPLPINNGTR